MGTAQWLSEVGRPLSSMRRGQLKRIKSFLKLEVARTYQSPSGVNRCVGASRDNDFLLLCCHS